jgi:hypothetical protein
MEDQLIKMEGTLEYLLHPYLYSQMKFANYLRIIFYNKYIFKFQTVMHYKKLWQAYQNTLYVGIHICLLKKLSQK